MPDKTNSTIIEKEWWHHLRWPREEIQHLRPIVDDYYNAITPIRPWEVVLPGVPEQVEDITVITITRTNDSKYSVHRLLLVDAVRPRPLHHPSNPRKLRQLALCNS